MVSQFKDAYRECYFFLRLEDEPVSSTPVELLFSFETRNDDMIRVLLLNILRQDRGITSCIEDTATTNMWREMSYILGL